MRKKLSIAAGIAVLIASLSVLTAGAAGSWSFGLGSLIATGWVAGIGNSDVDVTLTATGSTYANCENPGGRQAAGRNPIYVETSVSVTWSSDDNGRVNGTLQTPDVTLADAGVSPTPKSAGCPNGNWTVVNLDDDKMDWTGANITVVSNDGSGDVYFDQDYSCDTTHDANGYATDVDCTPLP